MIIYRLADIKKKVECPREAHTVSSTKVSNNMHGLIFGGEKEEVKKQ